MGHFPAILKPFEQPQTIAYHRRCPPKNRPVSFPRWGVFIFSCDVHCCDGNRKYLSESYIKARSILITMLKSAWKSVDKELRYSKISSKILSMLNFLLQHIACDFEASQRLWNTPWQVCSIAACGPGLLPIARATRCNAIHLRWCVPNVLRCLKIACDVLR